MNVELLDKLRCPVSHSPLQLSETSFVSGNDIVEGMLSTSDGKYQYHIKNSIPRFVPASNYADNFGMQWNYFSKTQLDSHSGYPISSERFWNATGWKPEQLKDHWVLDIGCGSGRFAEIALKAGAKVVALDYSSAVDACYENLKSYENLFVVQGDIYALPFAKGSFQFVYSLGVLQHTPNVKQAFEALPPMVAPNGRLCVDYYWKRFQTVMHAKYLFRPITKRMQQDKLFSLLKRIVPTMLSLSRTINKLPVVGKVLKRTIPVADYTGIYPLSEKQLSEWALLDTFDMLGPQYDSPQTKKTIHQWMSDAGMQDIQILHQTLLVSRGIKR
jgi:2-polyprenyl-3-methyl-5-hydroxy-6-metoxy-1,4-benzoquinol methylase